MTTVESLAKLHALATPIDGDMIYVRGFRNRDDGGGGFFIFDASSTLEPFYQDIDSYKTFEEMLKVGYNENYDGMVCKPYDSNTVGRWIRQWDRGKLNLRWFGGAPGGRIDGSGKEDASKALNAALKYAQFKVAGYGANLADVVPTIYNDRELTRPGKTIFIPSGRYYFKTFISTITYGVVIEGEGNMGTSAHGTRLLIFHRYNDFKFLDPKNPTTSILPVDNEEGAFFRFYANKTNNSGGGIKNLSIEIPKLPTPSNERLNRKYVDAGYNANIIALVSQDKRLQTEQNQDCPALAKWKAENVFITMRAKAKRAIIMLSEQKKGGSLPWRIRDTTLMNCWFAGASIAGETVKAIRSSGLHIIGGFFASGLGARKPILPGIFLEDCANTHLNGVDLTHGIIKIEKKSRFINIDCRFGKLLIYNGEGKKHVDLQVSKRYVLNPRTDTTSYDLLCPFHSNTNTSNYKCYNNAQEIEDDYDTDWMHVEEKPTT